jgi:hypothetical protein
MKISEIFSKNTVRESASTSYTPAPRLVPDSKSFKCHSCGKIKEDSEFTNPDIKICKNCESFAGPVAGVQGTSSPSSLPATDSKDGRGIENIYVPSHKECDCIDHLVNDSEGLKKALDSIGREGKEEYHRNISGMWRSMMNEPDDDKRAANVAFLTTLKRTHPANEHDEFANHYLMHLYGGGQSWVDHGIRDEELGDNFKNSQHMVQSAELGAKSNAYHNLDNCGACEQYLTSIKNHAKKFQDRLEKNILFAPGKAQAGAAATMKGIFDGWAKGEPLDTKTYPSLRDAHDTLDAWNNHTAKSHKYTFNNFFYNYAKVDAPTGEQKKTGKPEIKDMFYRMRDRLPGGWSRTKNVIPEEKELPVRDSQGTPTIDQDTPQTLLKMLRDKAIKDNMLRPDKVRHRKPSINIVPIIEEYPYTDEHGTQMFNKRENYVLKEIPAPSEVTTEYGAQSLTGFPGQGQFSRSVVKPHQQTYNRAEDPRFKKDFYDEPFAVNDAHPEVIEKKYKDLPVPRQHKFLFERAGMMPNIQPWVDYHAGKGEQSVGQKAQARLDYHRSFDEALGRAYPNVDRQEAVSRLESEHSSAAADAERMQSESLQSKNRYLQASKESNTMENKKFNSREAHFDPSAIVHGIGHAWDYVTNSMQHPFNEMIKGNEDDVAKGAKWLTRWKAENPAPSPDITTQVGQTVYNEALQHAKDHASNFATQFHGIGEAATGLAGDVALGIGVGKAVNKINQVRKDFKKYQERPIVCQSCGTIVPHSDVSDAIRESDGRRVPICSDCSNR